MACCTVSPIDGEYLSGWYTSDRHLNFVFISLSLALKGRSMASSESLRFLPTPTPPVSGPLIIFVLVIVRGLGAWLSRVDLPSADRILSADGFLRPGEFLQDSRTFVSSCFSNADNLS